MTPCIEAKGEKRKGYIYLQVTIRGKRKKVRAHRQAWEDANGPIAEGIQVLHRCDNRACRNLDHLFLGDNLINMADRDAKGRQNRGDKHPCAKLNWPKVREIRASTSSDKLLSQRYGVTVPTIWKIRAFKLWNDLT